MNGLVFVRFFLPLQLRFTVSCHQAYQFLCWPTVVLIHGGCETVVANECRHIEVFTHLADVHQAGMTAARDTLNNGKVPCPTTFRYDKKMANNYRLQFFFRNFAPK